MHLLLTGATGLVGTAVLQHMLTMPSITKITIISRRPVPLLEKPVFKPYAFKVNTIIITDFSQYPPSILEQVKDAEGCVWAQGMSINDAKTMEEYEAVTVTWPLNAARAFKDVAEKSGKPFKFVYVSGEGASTEPTTWTPRYGIYKGRAEKALLDMHKEFSTFLPYSVRPGVVNSHGNPEIVDSLPTYKVWMRLAHFVVDTPLRILVPSQTTPTREMGKVMVELAMGDGARLGGDGIEGEGRTVRNSGIRRIAGL